MRAETLSALDDYYAHLFGIERTELWRDVTVRAHSGRLADYEGYYVAWRHDGVHISLPRAGRPQAASHALATTPAEALRQPDFWREFAAEQRLQVIGPSSHAYLDEDPGPVDDVSRLCEEDLSALRRAVEPTEWDESGWNDQPPHLFGRYEVDLLVAAANLTLFQGHPRDIGVIVARGSRGRGLSEVVGQQAASFAIRAHGFARWGARDTNAASVAASRRLGFQPWCAQLAIR